MTIEPWGSLLRHFADLRDGDHQGERTRAGKLAAFHRTVGLLDPIAGQVLTELNNHLLLGAGTIERDAPPGGDVASWSLTWPEQRDAGVAAVRIVAHFSASFHHPHLRGETVGEWPLNVSTPEEAAALTPTLRAVVAADLHNLVFAADYRIVPATTAG